MKQIKRIVVAVVGGTVLAVGVVLIVLPGPAFLVIPVGLAILAVEFAWARRWLRSARALLPLNAGSASSPKRKQVSFQSLRRGAAFLLRQARRTLLPKRKLI
ncbi:MAG TPA: PGPGW domain-containing protein [Candidatus Paceibacterota bacterium]|nr:PGPGW domain-containing protein [Candidatus Paceibacterota bacterium]